MMQQELIKIHQKTSVSVIHVTHDFEEAITLGNRVAVLNRGEIVQIGSPEDILRRPKSEFIANFSLSRNIFFGEAKPSDESNVSIVIRGTEIIATTILRGMVHASVRPEDIFISGSNLGSFERNCFEGIVSDIIERGLVIYVKISVPLDFICLATRQAFGEMKLTKGKKVWIAFKTSSIYVF